MLRILSFRIFISYSQKVMPLNAAMTYCTKIILESSLSKMIFVQTVHRQSPVNLLAIIIFQNAETQVENGLFSTKIGFSV